jgi:hypothetical protein
MNKFVIIGICVFLLGCKKEDFKKIDAETLAKKEFKNLNLKQVDQFPLFKTCDETGTRQQQKSCFEKQIHRWLKPHVDSLNYDTSEADTLHLYLSIDTKGLLILDSLKTELKVSKQFDRIFKHPPKIYPAQKRGVPVKVAFQLPVILNIKSN